MDETRTEIESALTAEEWARRGWADEFCTLQSIYSPQGRGITGVMATRTGKNAPVVVQGESLPAMMALANAALPDGDPRKITRADVDTVRSLAEAIGGENDPDVRALTAKLAALLPPE